jgi:FixJ family two-component response regulator
MSKVPPMAGTETRQIAAGMRTLVVDDEPHVRALLARLCEEFGFLNVEPYSNAAAALAAVKKRKVDLMLLDLNMPVVRGEEVAFRTLEKWPDCVIIVVTGDASVEATVELMRAGVFDLIAKPVELSVIRATLRRAVKRLGVREHTTGPVERRIGRYEVIEEIGSGGMGSVYKAREPITDEIVAIKTLRMFKPNPDQEIRFQIEASTMARLDHEHIVRVRDTGLHEGTHYLVMDFIPGVDLAELIYRNRLTIGRGAEIIAKVADAVGYAHREGVLHRDLKPSNILVDAASEPHVIDFGLAKLLNSGLRLTHSDVVIGTFGYLAPERILGGKIGEGVDVYAMGAILYEMFTHRLPYERPDQQDIYPVFTVAATPPRELNPNVPEDLENICMRAIAVERKKRYSSADDLARDLRSFLGRHAS